MKKIALSKIPFIPVLLIIISLSIIPASIFLTIYFSGVAEAEALLGFQIGMEVLKPPMKCVLNNIDGDCLASCPICGDLADCNGLIELDVRALNTSAKAILYKGTALCMTPEDIRPANGGTFRTGSRCSGIVMQTGKIYKQRSVGCYR